MKIGNDYISKKQIIILLILLTGLIISVYLVLNRQIIKSRAAGEKPFEVIQNTTPQQAVSCEGNSCATKSLNIIIKPKVEIEGPNEPIPAIVR